MAIGYLRRVHLFSRDVRLYLASWAIAGFTRTGVYAVLFNLYVLRLGYGPEFIGLIHGVGALTFAASALPAGALGTRWGSRRTMIAGITLLALGSSLLPLAEFIPVPLRVGWLLATRSLGQVGAALYIVNCDPYLMGATSAEERNHVFAVASALTPLSGFIGSLVAGVLPGLVATVLHVSLDDPTPYGYLLMIAGMLLIPALLGLRATREVSEGRLWAKSAEARNVPYSAIVIIPLLILLLTSGQSAAGTFINVYLDAGLRVPIPLIGTVLAVCQLLAVPGSLAMPLLAERLGKGLIVVWGSLGVVLGLLLLALIPHWGAAGLGFAVVRVCVMIVDPAFSIYRQEVVPARWRPAMSGAIVVAMGIGQSAMAFGGGYMITALGYGTLFLTGAGLTVFAALLFWAYSRVPRGELASSSASDEPLAT